MPSAYTECIIDSVSPLNWVGMVRALVVPVAADRTGWTLLENKRPWRRYDIALARGWPIATGIIEGAWCHLVKDRLDITGARWSLTGAEAVLKLRALIANGDFDAYWVFHLRAEHHRIHQARYQHHTASQPEPGRRRVGPGRGVGIVPGPFPRISRRTRRAPVNATGSPRHLPSGGVRRAPGGWDAGSPVAVARHGGRGHPGECGPVG